MILTLNAAGFANAQHCIAQGSYDIYSPWLFDGERFDKYKPADWSLAVKNGIYAYSFLQNGSVSRAALVAVRISAERRNETDISLAAQELLDAIDAKEENAKFFDHYYQKGIPPLIARDAKSGKLHLKSVKPTLIYKQNGEEDGVITSIISTATPDRCNDVMLPGGVNLKNFYGNPVVLWMHNDTLPAVARNVGIQANAQGLIAKTYFNQVTQLSKDLYQLYKNGDMFAFSVGFIPVEWEDEEIGTEENDYGDIQITTPVTQRVYKKWEMLEYSLVNIPMNPEAVTLSTDPRAAMEKMVRVAVQKGIISAESETLKYLGLDTAITSVQNYPLTTQNNSSMNVELNKEEKSGKELSEPNAKELATHVNNIEKGLEGIKSFLEAKGYDLKDLIDGDDDTDVSIEETAKAAITEVLEQFGYKKAEPEKKEIVLEEFYGA
ncbi:MAG TPA: HK97 family phage prohead protease [Candidatus Kapabacteria bacterium]|nr:HK97 family phage prohead protease [Candidatus Kapabacteria bacterium]